MVPKQFPCPCLEDDFRKADLIILLHFVLSRNKFDDPFFDDKNRASEISLTVDDFGRWVVQFAAPLEKFLQF